MDCAAQGYLHAGHLSLVSAARQRAEVVVVSIYVNPTQFSKNEDFDVYPHNLEEDHKKLNAMGVTAVFQPATLYHASTKTSRAQSARVAGATELQPGDHETFVQTELLQQPLCGESRPHFFKGVATVVTKLFNIMEPDVAIFGGKDYQQLQVIKRLVRDLDFGIEIVGMPIMREADGLAMSSRNALLTEEQREAAPRIHKALLGAQKTVASEENTLASSIEKEVADQIRTAGGKVDYVKVVDAETLLSVEEVSKQESIIAVAAFFGSVRLIDNVKLTPDTEEGLEEAAVNLRLAF